MIRVGVIGAGYWGPKHARVLNEVRGAELAMIADLDPSRLAAVETRFPHIAKVRDYCEILRSPRVDAVIVATPVSTHARIAREAILAGKHVLVEKPITQSSMRYRRSHWAAMLSGTEP